MVTLGDTIESQAARSFGSVLLGIFKSPVEPRRLVARIKTLLARSERGQLAGAK